MFKFAFAARFWTVRGIRSRVIHSKFGKVLVLPSPGRLDLSLQAEGSSDLSWTCSARATGCPDWVLQFPAVSNPRSDVNPEHSEILQRMKFLNPYNSTQNYSVPPPTKGTQNTRVAFSLLLRLHVVVFLVASFVSVWGVGRGRQHSGLTGAGITVHGS